VLQFFKVLTPTYSYLICLHNNSVFTKNLNLQDFYNWAVATSNVFNHHSVKGSLEIFKSSPEEDWLTGDKNYFIKLLKSPPSGEFFWKMLQEMKYIDEMISSGTYAFYLMSDLIMYLQIGPTHMF